MNETIFLKLKNFLGNLLGIEQDLIQPDMSFFQLGIDSVMLMTIVKEMNDEFKVDLSLSDITFQYNTIKLICNYMEENMKNVAEKHVDQNKESNENAVRQENKPQLSNEITDSKSFYTDTKLEDEENEMEEIEENYDPQTIYDLCQKQTQTIEKIFLKQLNLLQNIGVKKGLPRENCTYNSNNTGEVSCDLNQNSVPVSVHEVKQKTQPKIESAADSHIDISARNTLSEKQNMMLQQLINNLVKKTAKSKQLAKDYRMCLADLDEVAGFTMLLKELHYQISVESGHGSEMIDVDGNHYVDIAMGFGSLIFGHSPKFLMDALKEELERGMQLAPRHRLVGKVAELVCELTGYERATFTVTGTEAVMTAMKFARAYKRKSKIGVFTGCYHGHNDATLITKISEYDSGRPMAPGISKAALGDMILFNYNDMSAIDEIKKHKDELAAVIIEPVQSRRPGIQPVEFLKAVREVTRENDILMIFDEVITGFRCNTGGAKRFFGIEPDMSVFGKAVCNGMPIGVVVGKAKIMDVADGGMWNYGDDSYPMVEQTFYAGTFFKHPLTLVAAYEILSFYQKDQNALQNRLNEKTADLVAKLNQIFQTNKVPIQVSNFASLFRFSALNDQAFMDIFYYKLLDYGIFTWEGRTCFLSAAHTDEDINKIIDATRRTVQDMVDFGFYGDENDGCKKGLPDELFYD